MAKLPKKMKLWRVTYPKGALSSMQMHEVRERLNEMAFEPIDDTPDQLSACGVVSINDIDNSIDEDGIQFGSWILFNWREDSRKADKKAVARILKKRISQAKKEGKKVAKAMKDEWKEEIETNLARKAEPLPAVTAVYIHPESESVYFPVSNQKKLEAILGNVESMLGYGGGMFELENFGEDVASDWLENLWMRSVKGEIDFSPKSVGNEDTTTTSGDTTDLAFGKLNNKKCKSGNLMVGSASVDIGLNPRQLTVALNLEAPDNNGEKMDDSDEMVMRLDAVEEIFNDVERMALKFDGSGAEKVDEACRSMAGHILRT